jgi:glycosyltransferase involved in cell wall biosynthesis
MSLHRAKSIKQQITPHINRDDETVLYSYWCDDSALALTLLAEKRKKLKTVCRIHGWDVYFEASTLNYLPFRHFIASQLSTIYAISKRGQVYCKENWKVSDLDKVHVSRLGVTQQKNINPNPERFILVSCSNVIPLKRVDLIVKSLAKIEDKKIEWVHFGDGPQLKEVEKLANVMLPVHVSATFKGRVANQEVLNWYAENNPSVFINLSTTEGIPVSIMEAMSFGIPVIATDVGGTSEIVNNENGLLLRANPSEGEISDAITSFVDDRERMSLKSIAACQTWQKQYNADVNYSSFVDALLHHS